MHDRPIELARDHVGHERRRGAFLDDHPDVRVLFAQLSEEPRDQPACRRSDHADPRLAGHLGVPARHVCGDVVELVEDASGSFDHPRALLGQAAHRPVDERHAEFLLQAGDVARHVRLHRVERPRRCGERAVVGDRHQGGELPDVHLCGRYQVSLCSTCTIACSRAYFHKQVAVRTPPMFHSIEEFTNRFPQPENFAWLRDPDPPSGSFPFFGLRADMQPPAGAPCDERSGGIRAVGSSVWWGRLLR